MRDELNAGLPSDRFQVDWWINTRRVNQRLSRHPRPTLQLSQLAAAHVPILNPTRQESGKWLLPTKTVALLKPETTPLILVEIPANFQALRQAHAELAMEWRMHIREVFENLFQIGYLVTDFVHDHSLPETSYYVLSYGEATL
jgi:predicted GNAT superfamily acetyltransferase